MRRLVLVSALLVLAGCELFNQVVTTEYYRAPDTYYRVDENAQTAETTVYRLGDDENWKLTSLNAPPRDAERLEGAELQQTLALIARRSAAQRNEDSDM